MSTTTQIQARPQYIQDLDEALLGRIFGTPLTEGEQYIVGYDIEGNPIYETATAEDVGTLAGGIIDDPRIFNIPEFRQAGSGLQDAVAATLDTPEKRQAFMDRYQNYFMDEEGKVRFLGDASSEMGKGATTIANALTNYFPDAKSYLQEGRGSTGVKGIYDTALSGVRGDIEKGTDAFGAQDRATQLFSDARSAVKGGLGQYDVSDELSDARSKIEQAGEGQFGAEEAFDRRTGRAFELAEQGLGSFDPASADAYMNKYQEGVIDAALKRVDREGEKRKKREAQEAAMAGAFGGSRQAVREAETEGEIEEARLRTVANLMSQGYDKSMANAMASDEATRKRALQASGLTGQLGASGATLESKAYEDAAKRGLAAAGASAGLSETEEKLLAQAYENQQKRQISAGQELGRMGGLQLGTEAKSFEDAETRMLKAADMYRSMGLSSAEAQARAAEDEKKRSLETGRLMGGLGQSAGVLGGAQADIGKAYGQLGGVSADIGRVYSGMAPADLGFMYELGGKERQYGQQKIDFGRQNTLAQTQQALAPYSYAQGFLTGSPSAGLYGTFTQAPSTSVNPFLSGVGAYAGLQGLNQSSA